MIEKSERQKRREALRRPQQSEGNGAVEQGLTVHRADFEEAEFGTWTDPAQGAAAKLPDDAFEKPKPKPPLHLSAEQRNAIFQGGLPRITIERSAERPKPCPVSARDEIELSSQVSIVVAGVKETATEFELHYRVVDTRARLLGKAEGYASSPSSAIATHKAPEEQPMGGPQFRQETEPEAISREDQEAMTQNINEESLERLRVNRDSLKAQLAEMKDNPLMATSHSEIDFARRKIEGVIEKVELRIRRGEAKPGA